MSVTDVGLLTQEVEEVELKENEGEKDEEGE